MVVPKHVCSNFILRFDGSTFGLVINGDTFVHCLKGDDLKGPSIASCCICCSADACMALFSLMIASPGSLICIPQQWGYKLLQQIQSLHRAVLGFHS